MKIGDFRELVATYLTIDFGDGSEPLQLDLGEHTPETDGSLTVTVDHDYSKLATPEVTITAEIRAAGARGTDRQVIAA